MYRYFCVVTGGGDPRWRGGSATLCKTYLLDSYGPTHEDMFMYSTRTGGA